MHPWMAAPAPRGTVPCAYSATEPSRAIRTCSAPRGAARRIRPLRAGATTWDSGWRRHYEETPACIAGGGGVGCLAILLRPAGCVRRTTRPDGRLDHGRWRRQPHIVRNADTAVATAARTEAALRRLEQPGSGNRRYAWWRVPGCGHARRHAGCRWIPLRDHPAPRADHDHLRASWRDAPRVLR